MLEKQTTKYNEMSMWNVFLQRYKIVYIQQGRFSSFDSIYWNFKNIFENFDVSLFKNSKKQEVNISNTFNWFFSFNSNLQKIYQNSFLILIDTNPRFEVSSLNIMIGKHVSDSNAKIYNLGNYYNLYYNYNHIGLGTKSLLKLVEGRSVLSKNLRSIVKGSLIIGSNLFSKNFGYFYTFLYEKLLNKSFCNQHFINSNVSDLMLLENQKNLELSRKFFNNIKTNKGIFFFSENDNQPSLDNFLFKGTDIINQNSHIMNIPLNKNQQLFNIPIKSYYEKSSLLINLENKIQFASKVISPFNSNLITPSQFFFSYILSNFEFLRVFKQNTNNRIFSFKKSKINENLLSNKFNTKNNINRIFQKSLKNQNLNNMLFFENKFKVRKRINSNFQFVDFWKHFDYYNFYYYFQNKKINNISFFKKTLNNFNYNKKIKIKNTIFSSNVKDFYLTDVISQNSPTMLNCSFFSQNKLNFKNIIE